MSREIPKAGIFTLLVGLASLGVLAYAILIHHTPERQSEPVGTFPAHWAAGVDCVNAPPFEVHAYDEDFYIIRQSMCLNYEAPFLFLFIGGERALLMDTGAVPDADLYGTVMDILARRADELGSRPVPLVVAHTHSHSDHRSADPQFLDAPGVETLVGLSVDEVMDFWDFADWPNDTPTFDLGDRVFDVIGIPGHHGTSIALYDRRTGVLLTGDSVYPGHLFIPSAEAWPVVGASLERLVAFAETRPVSWVLGNHIEVSSQPHEPYVYRTVPHADERELHFAPSKLEDVARAVRAMGDTPRCEIYEDFVIHPTYLCSGDWNG